MSILIRGMEMPKSCMKCKISYLDKYCSLYCPLVEDDVGPDGQVDNRCPLVPVPQHGDLVDRAEMREIAISLLDKAVTDQEANAIREMWSYLGQMPVFIPAEEGE